MRTSGLRLLGPAALGLALSLPTASAAQPAGPPWPPPPPVRQPPPVNPVPFALPWLLLLVAAGAAARQQQDQEEEEAVAPHVPDPPAGVEYKILRGPLGAFRNRDRFRAVLDEEARAGWELFEVLDTNRIRLRRAVSWRDRDAELTQDPYRTRVGGGEAKVIVVVLLSLLVGFAVVGIVIAVTVR